MQDFFVEKERVARWIGMRQDSGDPLVFVDKIKNAYMAAGVECSDKLIVFSDSLNVEKAIELKAACDKIGFKCESHLSLLRNRR